MFQTPKTNPCRQNLLSTTRTLGAFTSHRLSSSRAGGHLTMPSRAPAESRTADGPEPRRKGNRYLTLLKLQVLALARPGGGEGGPAEIPRMLLRCSVGPIVQVCVCSSPACTSLHKSNSGWLLRLGYPDKSSRCGSGVLMDAICTVWSRMKGEVENGFGS